jgi:hypothetical protein
MLLSGLRLRDPRGGNYTMKSLIPAVLMLIVAPLLLVGCEGDGDTSTGKRVVLGAGEVHEGWFFASGDQVLILGTVEGDLYVAGGRVQVDGTVNGDLLVAGGSVSIGGRVSDDVRAAGGNIECSGDIGKNLSVAGGNIRLTKTATVEGGVLAAGGDIRLGGVVGEDVKVAGGQVQLEGIVGGNVRCAGEHLSTVPGAAIHGDLQAIVKDPENAQISPGTVDGSLEVITEKHEVTESILGYSAGHFWFKIVWALSLLLTVVILVLLCPQWVESHGLAIWERPGWSLLWGVVGVIVTPIVAIALCVTLVGIPLGILLLFLYFWSLYLTQLSLGIVVGQKVFLPESKGRLMFAAIAGIVLVQVLTFVPYLGTLVVIAGLLLGLGGIIETVRHQSRSAVNMSPPIA